jgi:thioredoxin-related protein
MKKILLSIIFICVSSLTLLEASALKYANSYKEAIEQGVKEHKHVILFANSPFCPWCRKMEHDTLSDENVIKLLNEKYIFLSVDLSLQMETEDIPSRFLPQGTPVTFVIDPETQEGLFTMRGYKSPKSFIWRLEK